MKLHFGKDSTVTTIPVSYNVQHPWVSIPSERRATIKQHSAQQQMYSPCHNSKRPKAPCKFSIKSVLSVTEPFGLQHSNFSLCICPHRQQNRLLSEKSHSRSNIFCFAENFISNRLENITSHRNHNVGIRGKKQFFSGFLLVLEEAQTSPFCISCNLVLNMHSYCNFHNLFS